MSEQKRERSTAAFEVGKGSTGVLTLSEAEVERYLDPEELMVGLEDGFRRLESGEIQSPPRPVLSIPGKGFSAAMTAWGSGSQITVKIVSIFDRNLDAGLPNHLALINLFDPDTGLATCVMDGTFLTGVRTAASAVLSARMLSRTDSRIATVIGAGVQGREHLRLLPLVRDLERINVCSRVLNHAEKLASRSPMGRATSDVEAAVRESDIICLATHSPAPVIQAGWVSAGAHISSVGCYPPDGELPKELAREHRLFVESLHAFQPAPVGCSELSGLDPATGTTLGAVALGRRPGRINRDDITVYKAMGIAMEDLVAANLVYRRARRERGGSVMVW